MPENMILIATESLPNSRSGISPLENFDVGDWVMIDLVVGIALLLVTIKLTPLALRFSR